jgi:hypothetical protein
MRPSLSFLLALALLSLANGFMTAASAEEKEFEVIPNPHCENVCFSNLDGFLEPYYLLTNPLPTQPETFQELSYAKVMSVPVPVYRMKQPARLSEQQLEFQMVLVRDLSTAGKSNIHEVSVDFEKAKDSWFPGYYWSPLVLYCSEANEYQHVGWKFTSLLDKQQRDADLPSHFYALMVQMDDREKQALGIRIVGFRAPAWMAAKIMS